MATTDNEFTNRETIRTSNGVKDIFQNRKKLIQASIVTFFVVAIVILNYTKEIYSPMIVVETRTAKTTELSEVNYFADVFLEAKSAYVYDVVTGKVLYQKNAENQLPLASVTKVMTVLTASTLVPDYRLISITPDNIKPDGDSGLTVGEEWNIRKLINFALVVSSNDAMNAIASVAGAEITKEFNKTPEELFVNQMNVLSKSIGLTQTYFVNESGLDVTDMTSGGYGSAKDMAKLFQYIIENKPTLLEATQYEKLAIASKSKVHTADNTNKIVSSIPALIASKTGLTDLSGGNLVIAFDAGLMRPIIISVLGSSEDGRFSDMQKLVEASLYSLKTP